jgi:hypothetical protein
LISDKLYTHVTQFPRISLTNRSIGQLLGDQLLIDTRQDQFSGSEPRGSCVWIKRKRGSRTGQQEVELFEWELFD